MTDTYNLELTDKQLTKVNDLLRENLNSIIHNLDSAQSASEAVDETKETLTLLAKVFKSREDAFNRNLRGE